MMSKVRRGATLLEMVILISTTSAMLLVTIGLIHQTLRWSRDVSNMSDELRTNQQLTSQFLIDTQEAKAIELIDQNRLKITSSSTYVIQYVLEGNQVIRNRIAGRDSSPNASESFIYLPDRSLQFFIDAKKNLLRLQLNQSGIEFDNPKVLWTLECHAENLATGVSP